MPVSYGLYGAFGSDADRWTFRMFLPRKELIFIVLFELSHFDTLMITTKITMAGHLSTMDDFFPLTDSLRADKALDMLFGYEKPIRIMTV